MAAWCAATVTVLNIIPIISVTTAKILASKKTESPMGTPMASCSFQAFTEGANQRTNRAYLRITSTLKVITIPMMKMSQ
ncbi:Uncharacterised protein [Mycobacterium tuberculosis]|nr:Uncharacterised protein [Mycobacterium tuberculosis]